MSIFLIDLQAALRELVPLAFALLGAITFRVRGSALWDEITGTGTIGGRLQYAAILMLAALAFKGDWRLLLLLPALWIGCLPAWFGHGLVPADLRRLAMNALRGVLWLMPAGLLLWGLGYEDGWMLCVVGAASGPVYWLAYRIPFWRLDLAGHVVVGPGTELAELGFGAWIGIWLYAALAGV